MLTAKDIRGVYAMAPTPCKADANRWDTADSVDLDESARMVEKLIQDGIGGIALCGTTGEGAALLWEEKRAFIDTAVQVARKRVPVFGGATALGTKEVVRQMRGLKDVGADGAFLGLPLWQTPTIETQVRFYADLSEAVPDMPIMVYANAMFFKSTFPTPFWAGIAKRAPTVVAVKYGGAGNLLEDFRVAGHQVNFLPSTDNLALYSAYKLLRTKITACWSTSAPMGPEPVVAWMDAVLRDDEQRVDEIYEDIRALPPHVPPAEANKFPEYNAQVVKWRVNASGYINCGPSRAPYYDLPKHWQKQAELHGKAWAELRKKYAKAPVA